MNVLGVIMRIYSYIFHFLLSAFLLALSVVTLIGGTHNLKLDMLPWKEAQLTYGLLIVGILGLLCVALALKGILRLLFFLWTLAVVVFMVKGYFFSAYVFSGANGLYSILALIVGSILASTGAWLAFREKQTAR